MIGPAGGITRPGGDAKHKEKKEKEDTMEDREDDGDETAAGPTENLLQPGKKINMDDF